MKKAIALFIACVLFLSAGAEAEYALSRYYNKITIGVNNTNLKSKLYNIDNHIYVPIRALAEYLGIPVEWDEDMQHVKLMTNDKIIRIGGNTDIGNEGVIPDEETAYQVGKIILEKHCGKSLEYENDNVKCYIKAVYHPYDNSWRVYQEFEFKGEGRGGTGVLSPTVVLNRNTGEVTYINTDPLNED